MPRSARLRRPEQFAAALAQGSRGARRYFTVFAKPNGLGQARIGIVTSKRVAPRAVDRNRVKRMVREVFRSHRGRLGSLDVVIRLRRCPTRGSGNEARSELARLLAELDSRKAADGR
ncbi:MAG: ribonuclease P protein component [Betaproteobacteria bacterium]|nr:MAG: ribonuclease P protein component [Betaproteobacteria bacterium]